MLSKSIVPPFELNELKATEFLNSPNRAVMFTPVMNFRKIMNDVSNNPIDDNTLSLLQCATLTIEAALPSGMVDTSPTGSWNIEKSTFWRSLVMKSNSPGDLMGCIVLLENVISKDWLRPNAEHLLACLSRPWKAINDASVSSIALRLWVLDRGIKYGLIVDEDGEWQSLEDEVELEVDVEE